MKKSILSAATLLLAGIAFLSVLPLTNVHAAGPKNATVKYVGVQEDAVLFNVAFDNPTGSKMTVSVLDENGTTLFQDVFTDRKFEKKFKLSKSESGKITFIVRDSKVVELNESFSITTKVVEDVVVTKTN